MINDHDIDLTEEHKFSVHNGVRVSLARSLGIRHVPWEALVTLDNCHPKRSYGDYLSDTFGETIRRTSDNKFFLAGRKYAYSEEILEEFFMEEFGRIPNNAMQYCFRCGTTHINPDLLVYCSSCETRIRAEECSGRLFGKGITLDRYVPWLDYWVRREDNQTATIQKPSDIMEAVIKKY